MVQTAISKALTTLNQVESAFNLTRTVEPQFFTLRNELHDVLQILKRLGQRVLH
jgi:hypothetical protein